MRRAFTLIESLIVVACIGLMGAICLPVFVKVREQARKTVCTSNLRQIGLAIDQYTSDYEVLPPEATRTAGLQIICTWQDLVFPYIKNEHIFSCPADLGQHNAKPVPYVEAAKRGPASAFGSYGCNTLYQNGASPFEDARFGTVYPSELAEPAATVAVTDGWPNRFRVAFVPSGGLVVAPTASGVALNGNWSVIVDGQNPGGVVLRHFGAANVLFADGHVKAMRSEWLVEKRNVYRWWTVGAD